MSGYDDLRRQIDAIFSKEEAERQLAHAADEHDYERGVTFLHNDLVSLHIALTAAEERVGRLEGALEPFLGDAETWLRIVTETAGNTYPLREDMKLRDGRTVADWVRLARALLADEPTP